MEDLWVELEFDTGRPRKRRCVPSLVSQTYHPISNCETLPSILYEKFPAISSPVETTLASITAPETLERFAGPSPNLRPPKDHGSCLYHSGDSPGSYSALNKEYGPTPSNFDAGSNKQQSLSGKEVADKDKICYGMIAQIHVLVQAPEALRHQERVRVNISHMKRGIEIVGVKESLSAKIASQLHAKVLQELVTTSDLVIESYISIQNRMPWSHAIRQRKIDHGPSYASGRAYLNVVLYGPSQMATLFGGYLLSQSIYLQKPRGCSRDVIYRNPQRIELFQQSDMTAFQIQSDHDGIVSLGENYTVSDPSDDLETTQLYPDEEPPPAILTKLLQHQKQGLYFMRKRESGWDFDASNTIWKPYVDPTYGKTAYCNTITRETISATPLNFRGGILADTMGFGKTLIVLSHIVHDLYISKTQGKAQSPDPSLIVITKSLMTAWQEQISLHVDPSALKVLFYRSNIVCSQSEISGNDVVITTYDIVMSQYRKAALKKQPLFLQRWRRIILDEAHEIRNSSTKKAKAVIELKSDIRWAVSGTPIQNSLADLASLFKFLQVFPDANLRYLKDVAKLVANDSIAKDAFLSICLRRPKCILSLPDKSDQIYFVNLNHQDSQAYKAVYSAIDLPRKNSDSKQNYHEYLVVLNRLRQICNLGISYQSNSFKLDSTRVQMITQEIEESVEAADAAVRPTYDNEFATEEGRLESHASASQDQNSELYPSMDGVLSSKVLALQDYLLKLSFEDKSVIFSFWTTTLDMIEIMLRRNQISFTRIDGNSTIAERSEAVEKFQRDPHIRVILLSLRCGANGLNLAAANYAFLIEPQWNPMVEDQAFHRIYRIGQTRPVTTVRFITRKTIEERIRRVQANKLFQADQCFGQGNARQIWKERVTLLLSDEEI